MGEKVGGGGWEDVRKTTMTNHKCITFLKRNNAVKVTTSVQSGVGDGSGHSSDNRIGK